MVLPQLPTCQRRVQWPLKTLKLPGVVVSFVVGVLASLVGCQPKPPPEQPGQPFVFRSLNLQQRDLLGQPTWSLTSPEARYDLGRRLAQAREIQGVMYTQGRPAYRLTASSATVLNDGEVIQLEGWIRLRRLGDQPLQVLARRARWYPGRRLMVLDLQPVATQRDLRLTAEKARFLLDQNRLELRVRPMVERSADGHLTLKVNSADWNTETGEISTVGPVVGIRRSVDQHRQVLTSPVLRGNSFSQLLTLSAPVRLEDPDRKAIVHAQETQIDVSQQIIQSTLAFNGVMNQSQVHGMGFQIFALRNLVVVPKGCLLQQPSDSLQARRCVWNWQTNQVRARGDVVLRRKANNQVTTAQRIDGHLGGDGLVEFTSPGSHVRTRLQLQANPPRAPRAGQPGAAGPPIQL